jgi:hypothetical protein
MYAAIGKLATIGDQDSLKQYVFGDDAKNADLYAKDESGRYLHLTPAIYPILSFVVQSALKRVVFTGYDPEGYKHCYRLDISSYEKTDDLCRQFVNCLTSVKERNNDLLLEKCLTPPLPCRSYNNSRRSKLVEMFRLYPFDMDAEVSWFINQDDEACIEQINIIFAIIYSDRLQA